jgi:hypothetical protein
MKSKADDSRARARLLESSPSAYFALLLKDLDELEDQLARRNRPSGGSGEAKPCETGDRNPEATGHLPADIAEEPRPGGKGIR